MSDTEIDEVIADLRKTDDPLAVRAADLLEKLRREVKSLLRIIDDQPDNPFGD
jgi:hypothetical protein